MISVATNVYSVYAHTSSHKVYIVCLVFKSTILIHRQFLDKKNSMKS